MTTFQIVSLLALAAAVLGVYGTPPLTSIRWPRKTKSGTMSHIEAIVAVRDAYTDPELTAACNALLAALLKVKA